MLDKILILDFGSQYTQLIARSIRELNVYCEIQPCTKPIDYSSAIKGVILSGSPYSVNDEFAPKPDVLAIASKVPVLGVCYGAQLIAQSTGGVVGKSAHREYGRAHLDNIVADPLFAAIENGSQVWMSHSDSVKELAASLTCIATTASIPVAAFKAAEGFTPFPMYGIQFHPEVTHTNKGKILLRNFVFLICKIKKNWSSKDQKLKLINEIKEQVGDNKVICGLSGGVDSSVVAQLLSKAIGKNLTCIFVNNGLLRKNEEIQVVNTFKKKLKINLIYVNAEKEFIRKLTNVSDPEKKRKIIGNLFIKIFERYANRIKNVKFLAQGTLYPDLIESKSVTGSQTSKIKSHHNVGGLPKRMKLKLVEPLKFLFKDEVRKLGLELNLSNDIISRHPFPGPGLAIRMPGIITNEKIKILKEADFYFIKALREHGLYDKIWQAYAALLPVKTVGVMGDNRTYEHICLLRAITSEDGMTADFFDFPKGFMQSISNQIINNIRGINRVVYDVTSKPPSTIELE